MDQQNQNNSTNNKKQDTPKFSFNWLYILLIGGLIFMIMTGWNPTPRAKNTFSGTY